VTAMTDAYALALLLTVLVECLLALAFARRGERLRLLAVAFFLNLLTHPLANLASGQEFSFLVVEVAVIAIEAVGYRVAAGSTWRRSAGLSLVLNTVTAAMSFAF